ncbi:c-type cytochrome [Sphingomonas sp. 3P27F8]|uniref:c-type cytochrome n=1 Tax=Sphingomonas sp. 3P27F8 TaxID=2502213 RepID=UPI0010F7CB98|nr:c-type cytochrome [Sphingomonas sp. 3P27F8]
MQSSAARLGMLAICAVLAAVAACSAEKRPAAPSQPQTPPTGPEDPRISAYENNSYQLSQGGRYFAWYGCSACHAQRGGGGRDLADKKWVYGGEFDQVYRTIAGHGGLTVKPGQSIPPEQLWQLSAYVRSLNQIDPAKRRRQDLDQAGEPQADNWSGPVE